MVSLQNPEYSIELIVLVKNEGIYTWYLSEKVYWVLDYVKWWKIFGTADDVEREPRRKDFLVLDKGNWPEFEKTATDIRVTREQLSALDFAKSPHN